MHELGVGPLPIRRTQLEQKRLAAALDELMRDTKLRAAATRLGEQLRAEQGVQNAIRMMEETFVTSEKL